MNYTMMGDTVNLAARLESSAKQYGVYNFVGENIYEIAKDSYKDFEGKDIAPLKDYNDNIKILDNK